MDAEKLHEIHQELLHLRDEIQNIKDNHLHHMDIRLTKLETSLSVGWKAVLFGAGIPAILSAILSVIQLMK
jgi:L-lactate utilization protein LutB